MLLLNCFFVSQLIIIILYIYLTSVQCECETSILFCHQSKCFHFITSSVALLAHVYLHWFHFWLPFTNNEFTSAFSVELASVLELIGGGSRSTTPVSLNSRKSPTADMGVQVNQKDGNRRNSRGNNQQNQQQDRRDSGRLDGQGSHDNRVSSIYTGFFHSNWTQSNEKICFCF